MECLLGKTIQLNNFGITLYQELLTMGSDGPTMIQYFVIRPASNEWESKIYEFNPLFTFIKLLLKEDNIDAVKMILYNMQFIHTLPDMCYHNAVMIQSTYASNPKLLEEGYDDGKVSHAKMEESWQSLREIWIKSYQREFELYEKQKDAISEDMDTGADIASQMF